MADKLSLTAAAHKATLTTARDNLSTEKLSTPSATNGHLSTPTEKLSSLSNPNEKLSTFSNPTEKLSTLSNPTEKLSTLNKPTEKLSTLSNPTDKLSTLSTPVAMSSKLRRARDFDDVLETVGSFGRYQKTLMFLIFMPVSFFAAFTSNLLLFQLVVPDHWCRTPGRDNTSLSEAQWRNLTRPRSSDTGELSQCLMHDIEWTSHHNTTTFTVTNQTKECSDGWEFDITQYTTTVATTLGWVCERDHYSHHTLSISMAGNAVGTLVLPILADKYVGRRLMFFIALVLHLVFSVPLLWVTDATWHKALRFLQGIAFETNYLMPFIIFMEVIPPKRRALAVMVSFIPWTFGMCSTALVAYLIPHWRYLIVISLLPSMFGFLYWRVLPDSPRWLLARGRTQETADILLQISVSNGVEGVTRADLEAQLEVVKRRQPAEQRLRTILAYPRLSLRALMLFLMSFMQYVVYSVAMLSMTVLPNSFVAHFVLSIFELPSNFIGWALSHYLGRRFMAYSTFLLLSGFCFAAYFCIQNEWLFLTILGFVKLFSTCGLFVVHLMASEVLPTPVRTSGMGVTIVFGMLGMVAAPHVLHSGLGEGGHYWILLAMTLVSVVSMIPMPETLGLNLPQTFQDAEDLGRDRPFATWIHHWNFHRHLKTDPHNEDSEHLMQKPK